MGVLPLAPADTSALASGGATGDSGSVTDRKPTGRGKVKGFAPADAVLSSYYRAADAANQANSARE